MIIADISNPFFANVARVVEDEAKRSGYTVIIGSCDENADKSWDLLNVLINRQVDGFIIVSSEHSENQVLFLKEKNIPFVLLDRHFPEIQTDFVATNNYKASFDACTHLIQGGYERIGLLAYKSDMYHMKERIRGCKHALGEHKKGWGNPCQAAIDIPAHDCDRNRGYSFLNSLSHSLFNANYGINQAAMAHCDSPLKINLLLMLTFAIGLRS